MYIVFSIRLVVWARKSGRDTKQDKRYDFVSLVPDIDSIFSRFGLERENMTLALFSNYFRKNENDVHKHHFLNSQANLTERHAL